ncbi:DUF1456 family protein [Sporosarcina sp. D27]|uniref:DUF1456 family protein n=1 Tax=Sporosarcina sp. D27 TaxID=1382305 RepID=UPI00055D3D43|nr:DUF1456 family protein [Sporosarcina sp. D27]
MNNNDILTRLRYALDIKDAEMVEIFKLGGVETTKTEVQNMLSKSKINTDGETPEEYVKMIDNKTLESFLNGCITLKRGPQEETPETIKNRFLMTDDNRNVNNILLKKMKIALSLTNEEMIDILNDVGVTLSKSELSAVLRKEGHRNYKECGDRYARNFLKGLAQIYRA